MISETTHGPNHLKVNFPRARSLRLKQNLSASVKYQLMLKIYPHFHNHVTVYFGPSLCFKRPMSKSFFNNFRSNKDVLAKKLVKMQVPDCIVT